MAAIHLFYIWRRVNGKPPTQTVLEAAIHTCEMRGNSSMVEYSLAKARVEGSNPFFRFTNYVLVAQWIERRTTDPEVESSTLSEHDMKGL